MASNSAFYPLFLHQFISQGIKLIRFLVFFAEYQKFAQKKGFAIQSFEKPVVLKVRVIYQQ